MAETPGEPPQVLRSCCEQGYVMGLYVGTIVVRCQPGGRTFGSGMNGTQSLPSCDVRSLFDSVAKLLLSRLQASPSFASGKPLAATSACSTSRNG
jgi:hypothetical protein